ncbi:hypothetical protein Nepgr_008416 [Nepenthes gracilis]|uniref:Uncharacterized protein n=1 Tax=Nepenthes gracilis TaxID=150966 RepID=A0AAD3S9P8_NEPGR|nr:hypothetical protein Nepgr_008416 [Nepenthes gracilis]
MWPLPGGQGIAGDKAYNRVPSSSSSSPTKSSSTSSSPPPPFWHSIFPNSNPAASCRTMEEVWKDINLSSLRHNHRQTTPLATAAATAASTSTTITTTTPTNFRGMIFQDFLTRPFLEDPPTTSSGTASNPLYGCPTPPPPATVLSLNSTPEFHFLDNVPHSAHLQSLPVPNFNSPFDAFASSPFLSSFSKKRFFEEAENGSVDRRHKLPISVQAYINELELEVAHLMEENARLRRQQEQRLFQAPPAQLPKKKALQRTSTAPF